MNPGRASAYERLARAAAQWPRFDFHADPVADDSVDARDRALGRTIERQTVRRWLTLEALLTPLLDREWSRVQPTLRAAMLGGAAQLLLMDRIPDHAVLDETVQWAKTAIRAGAAGMVNAVLRRVAAMRVERLGAAQTAAADARRDLLPLEDGSAWRLATDAFASSAPERLAQQTSHPLDLVLRWTNRFGAKDARRVCLHGITDPPLTVHGLAESAPDTIPHGAPGARLWTGTHAALLEALERHPLARVQDASSAMAVASLGAASPSLIIDACAGRGTKTLQLAGQFPAATIVASDPDDARRASLRDAARRAATAAAARVEVAEPGDLGRWAGRADLLVLDVPCSNSGVLARRPEAKYRFAPSEVDRLVALQRRIVDEHRPLLAPHGVLLYATCSLEQEENERMAGWICQRTGMTLRRSERRMPQGLPGDPPAIWQDGAFAAIFAPSR
jgi:16S rRNA (cytosine967-C5)-methyltransferase